MPRSETSRRATFIVVAGVTLAATSRCAVGECVGGRCDEPTHTTSTAPAGMALVPGGTFAMGSETGFPDEAPVHRVRVESFYLSVTEVTTAEYQRCVDEGRCSPASTRASWPELFPDEVDAWSQFCNAGVRGREQHPINCVEWSQADTYCRAHGWRLPSEEEFEYAARGGSEQRTYPWGESPPDETRLNACGGECSPVVGQIRGGWSPLYGGSDGWAGTAPVGRFPAGRGRWGHDDLSGNVWEWTSTLYCPYDDPGCFSDQRVVRGSGFLQANLLKTHATRRNQDTEWHAGGDNGFRCATSLGRNPRPGASAPSFTLMHQRPGTAAHAALLALTIALLVVIGAVLGLLGGGGSVLTLPIMLLVVGLVQVTAAAMSVTVLAATAPVSALAHARRGNVDLGVGLLFGAAGAAGAFVGGRVARLLPPPVLLAGFVVVMAVTARAMLRGRAAPPAEAPTPDVSRGRRALKALMLAASGAGVGVLSGLLGVGGGFLVVPVLTLLAGMPMSVAVGTSAVVITMNSLAGVVGQRAWSYVDWQLAVAFSLASIVGTLIGGRYSGRVSPQRLRRWFGVMVIVAGAVVLTRQALPGLRELWRSNSQVAPEARGERG